jgi:hypothetical protein
MRGRSLILAGCGAILALVSAAGPCSAQQRMYPVQGIWVARYQTVWGPAEEQMVLLHGGTFSKLFRCRDKMVYHTGRYLVGPGFIRLYHDRGPIRTETMWVRFDGPDRMTCEDRVIGTRWVAVRVGPARG